MYKIISTINNMCEKEKLFLEFIDGFAWKYDADEYENSLFGFKNGMCLFEIFYSGVFYHKNFVVTYRLNVKLKLPPSHFYINNEKIWLVFQRKFNMEYNETKSFMTHMIEKHFKTNNICVNPISSYWMNSAQNHFNNK